MRQLITAPTKWRRLCTQLLNARFQEQRALIAVFLAMQKLQTVVRPWRSVPQWWLVAQPANPQPQVWPQYHAQALVVLVLVVLQQTKLLAHRT